jgi:hypothetical protein
VELIWLAPAALLGLAALVLPVLIHLLTHQQTRHVPFPTLRFLRRTRLAALRRRSLHDWWLLAVRLAILAAAVAALAGPVFVSETRQSAWRQRVARAVVVAPGGASAALVEPLVESERRNSFVSEVFQPTTHAADGLRDAALWLAKQPPAAQEVVVIGDLRVGAIVREDLTLVPARVGVRFLPVPASASSRVVNLYFQEAEVLWHARTTLEDTYTRVSYDRLGPASPFLTVRAAPDEQAVAEAALNAVLTRGVDADATPVRRVVVVFDGGSTEGLAVTAPPPQAWMREALAALPEVNGGASGDLLVVRANVRGSDPDAARLLENIGRVVVAVDRSALEPARVSVQTLAGWSRPIGAFERGQPADEGDRRWFWAVTLLLMGVEMLMRRPGSAPASAEHIQESQVA